MSTKTPKIRFVALFVAALVAGGAQTKTALAQTVAEAVPSSTNSAVSVPDPAQQLRQLAQHFRSNHLEGLLRTALSPTEYQRVRAKYEAERLIPRTESERKEFAESWGKLIAPNAVEQWMTEIEPKLVEARPKMLGAMTMGVGALQIAIASDDNKLKPDQREALNKLLPGLQSWMLRTDFLSSESARKVATIITSAARSTGIQKADDIRNLSFEQLLARGDTMLAAAKQAVLVYDLDLNAIVDSLRVEVLENNGSKARVRTTVTIFNTPVSSEQNLELVDGRWFGKMKIDVDNSKAERNEKKGS